MTPMMLQYFEVKNQYKDHILFYRLGDFYEMFFDDAITASRELDLTLTGRDCGEPERAPMCGVPFHSAEVYIGKLIEKGYKVTAFDGSAEMCKIASSYIGQEVKHIRFEDFKEINKYDGIWACSSILHLEKNTLKEVLHNLSRALKDDGYIYASFKVGNKEGFIEDRYFSNFTKESFSCFLNEIKELAIHDVWITNDKRKIRCEELWLNTILKKV